MQTIQGMRMRIYHFHDGVEMFESLYLEEKTKCLLNTVLDILFSPRNFLETFIYPSENALCMKHHRVERVEGDRKE